MTTWLVRLGSSANTLKGFAFVGLLSAALGCGDADAATDTGGTQSSTGNSTATTNGGTTDAGTTGGVDSGATGGNTSGNSSGNTNGMQTGGSDGGVSTGGSTGGNMSVTDDPKTPGNDSPTAAACKGETSCGYSNQSCCVTLTTDASCKMGTTCGGTDVRTVCDGPEECKSGEECCVVVNLTAKNSCVPQGMCKGGTVGAWVLCHKDSDCAPGLKCKGNESPFPFWGFCK